jgi:diguanylate cyclase (GGDEF)-like protein/PAS domain S-box-containing protein
MTTSSGEENFHKSLIDNLYDGVYFVDTERLITYWNKGAERITGYPPEEVMGRYCHANILDHVTDAGQHLCKDGCPLMETIKDGKHRETEVYLRHASGHRVSVLVRTSPMYDEEQNIIGAVEVFSNNQSLFKMKRRVNELEKALFHDGLTDLGNRKFMQMKINTAINEFHQHEVPFGLLFIDIDNFKAINDTYGHQEGDRVLQHTASNLARHLRGTDVCGRWGGEEFVAVLYNINPKTIWLISEKIRAMIESSSIVINQEKISVTTSIGAAIVRDTDTMDEIVQRADHLMYRSKQGGRNKVTLED